MVVFTREDIDKILNVLYSVRAGEIVQSDVDECIFDLEDITDATPDELTAIGKTMGSRGAEVTSEPIWLFQVQREWVPNSIRDCYFNSDDCEDLTEEQFELMEDEGNICRYWDTIRVFFSREEAEAYGESKSYDYGEKNKDWRVYCISLWDTHQTKNILRAILPRKEKG